MLDGGSENDVLYGELGNDFMMGGKGDDIYYVDSSGDTVLEGADAGYDRVFASASFSIAGQHVEELWLTGTASIDFYFDTALSATKNVDRIDSFSVAEDTIMLDRTVFTGVGANGTLSSSAFFAGTAAQDADDRIVYDSASGKIFYDADGSGGGAAVLFAQVAAGTALTNLDFQAYLPPA